MLKAAAIPERIFRSGTGATSFPAPTLEAGPCAGSCEGDLACQGILHCFNIPNQSSMIRTCSVPDIFKIFRNEAALTGLALRT